MPMSEPAMGFDTDAGPHVGSKICSKVSPLLTLRLSRLTNLWGRPCPAAGSAAVAAGSLLPLHVAKTLQMPTTCVLQPRLALALQALLQSQQAALGPLLPMIQQGLQHRTTTPPGGTPVPKGRTQNQQDVGGGLQPVLLLADPLLEGLPLEALQASTSKPAPGKAAQLAALHCSISACTAVL